MEQFVGPAGAGILFKQNFFPLQLRPQRAANCELARPDLNGNQLAQVTGVASGAASRTVGADSKMGPPGAIESILFERPDRKLSGASEMDQKQAI